MIKIGVTSCLMYPDVDRKYFGPKTLCYFEKDMANFLTRDGVLPILIPDLDEAKLNFVLGECDGFVLQGGSDICPETYEEDYIDKDKWPGDKYRDDYELKIVDFAFKNKRPVLGVCRGMQLLNVYFGGTLNQDIASQIVHRDPIKYDCISHNVEILKGGLLDKIYDNLKVKKVNSVHHQSVLKLGGKLKLEAICPEDNTVEAFSYKNLDEFFAVGVQWHPEFFHTMKEELIPGDTVYDYFLEVIRGNK